MLKSEWDKLTKCGFSYQDFQNGRGAIRTWDCLIALSGGIFVYRDVTRAKGYIQDGETLAFNRHFKKGEIIC